MQETPAGRFLQPLAWLIVQRPLPGTDKRWILILCCLSQFMVILDVSVVNVALPSIRADLGFSAVDLQWVVNAYTLTFAGFLLLGGRAADLLGQRRVFLFGLALFAVASLAGGLSQTQGQLVIARAVQGLGGAVVAPVTLSILTTTFTEGAERNRALGAWGAMGAPAAPRARCSAACSPTCSAGSGSSSSTSRSASRSLAARRFVRDPETAAAGTRHYDTPARSR